MYDIADWNSLETGTKIWSVLSFFLNVHEDADSVEKSGHETTGHDIPVTFMRESRERFGRVDHPVTTAPDYYGCR